MTEVAIVGMGAVFPGAGDAPAFWRNVRAGVDAITDVPPDRWDPDLYCDPARAGANRFYTRRGGFLGELATFDPARFGIMPGSVDGTEPDQLLMLRAAAEALDDGGALPDRARVGVIIGRGGYLTPGVTRLDQRVSVVHQLQAVLSDLLPELGADRLAAVRAAFEEQLGPDDPQASIGLVPNFAASRLANRFDLGGPSYTVDAACASSLVAVDHAVGELASGRCDAVLAGGVHTCHHPMLWSVFTRLRVLSPAGVIRPFDAAADGTLLSEGTGAVLLKRLADARAAGDRVYAVIRGVGVSSDGRATSMLHPLAAGQELAIRRAWAAAGLDPAAPDALGLLEAHGTGTTVGDRVELTALGAVFGPSAGGRPIGIGSVKSMIGHAMPAAGLAGLIKAAFAVHEGVLPPTLHIDQPSPELAGTRFEPVTEARGWDDDRVRRAAVSAFGFGGINAHVVLESERAPARSRRQAVGAERRGRVAPPGTVCGETVLRLAAGGPAELARLLAADDDALLARAAEAPHDAVAASGDGSCRLAIVAPDARRLALARRVVERGTPWRGRSDVWFTVQPLLRGPEQVAFLFPGFEPGFTPSADGVAEAFGLPPLRLHGTAAPGAGAGGPSEDGDAVVRHALDIIAVSRLFAAALDELGISAGALAGHSLGEWTAMVAAGIYPDFDEFIASVRPGIVAVPDVVYLALGASAERAGALISGLDGVVVTHDNCPRQSVVCGPAEEIATAAGRARAAGILAQPMPFRTGFHSPAYAPHVPPIRRALAELTVRDPLAPIWSATTLAPFPRDPDQIRELVLRHLVEPVRFRQLTELLHEAGIRAFVQVGPGSLTGFTDDTLSGRDYLAVATATASRDGVAQLRRAAAALWADGLSPRFERFPQAGREESTARSIPRFSLSDGLTAAADSTTDRAAVGSVRLKLGEPLVRLAGLVPPIRIGAGRTAIPDAGRPALAELDALLAETAAAAESVVAALAQQARPAAPREVRAEREFSLRTMPDIADHCLFIQPEGWPDQTDRFPIVPMTTLLAIMGDAALDLAPGRLVTGFEQVRAVRWLTVAPPTRTAVRAAMADAGGGNGQPGSERVRVTIEGYASGYVLLAERYPAPPAADSAPLRGRRPPVVSARELYADRWMFHGPLFAGVASVDALADDGIAGTVLSLPARGALLDSVGQLIGHWMQVVPTVGQTVFPTGIDAVRLYGPQPPPGPPLDCVARIRALTDTEMRADAEVGGGDGRVWCRIEGWTTRRFATDDAILATKLHPERNALSWQAAGGWQVAFERWPDTASRELIMRLYLNAAERAEYERLPPLRQRRWLLGRIAVKDAVRRSLWERGAGPVFPAELTVRESADGVLVRGALLAPPVSLAVSADGHGRPCAVALAGPRRWFSIQADDGDAVLLTEHGRVVRLTQTAPTQTASTQTVKGHR